MDKHVDKCKCGSDLSKGESVMRRYSQYIEYGHYLDGVFVNDENRSYDDICAKCVQYINSNGGVYVKTK